jgi:hypothetical protein
MNWLQILLFKWVNLLCRYSAGAVRHEERPQREHQPRRAVPGEASPAATAGGCAAVQWFNAVVTHSLKAHGDPTHEPMKSGKLVSKLAFKWVYLYRYAPAMDRGGHEVQRFPSQRQDQRAAQAGVRALRAQGQRLHVLDAGRGENQRAPLGGAVPVESS